jgi:uncharacterized protein YabE (DUF348 family)
VPGWIDVRSLVRRSPLAIVLLTAVLAAFAAATTAFAVMDKTVTVKVDGQRLTVRTFAGDVAGVLRKAGVDVGPHDTVAPDLTAPVRDGSTVIVQHGRLLHVNVDGKSRSVWVTAMSVRGALSQLGYDQSGIWLSASRSQAIPRQGLSLSLRLPQRVTVLVAGHRHSVRTTAPTVRALLKQTHVRVHPLDHVSVPMTRYPTNGLVVTVDRITQRRATRSVAIPFATKHVRTSSLYVGQTNIRRYGQPGVRLLTYRYTFKNHKLTGQKLLSSKVRSHPVSEIIAVGTTPRPAPTYPSTSAGSLNWSALAQCESGGNPRAVSADGNYRGLYQFTMSTWASLGGSGDPINASSSEQTYRAQLLYQRSGDSSWPSCGQYLYT